MIDNQERMRHDSVIQHASVSMEKARPSRFAVGETSFDAEALSFRIHMSPTHHKAHVVSNASVPDDFLGNP